MVNLMREPRLDRREEATRVPGNASIAELVQGIVGDMQRLTAQQLALFKEEMAQDLNKARQVAVSWSLGLGGMLIGGIVLAIAIAQLIAWCTPLPLWLCCGIVGVAAAVMGASLVYAGVKRLESLHPLPEQSMRALKENVQCLTNPRR